MDIEFVKTKDLVPGACYISTKNEFSRGTELEGWRETYVFLGRTDHGGFLWGFVGAPRIYMANPVNIANTYFSEAAITGNLSVTQSNKRITKLTYKEYLSLNDYILDYNALTDEVKDKIERAKKFR